MALTHFWIRRLGSTLACIASMGAGDGAVSKSLTFVDRPPTVFVRRGKILPCEKRANDERAVVRRVSDSLEANSGLAYRNDSRWKPDGY